MSGFPAPMNATRGDALSVVVRVRARGGLDAEPVRDIVRAALGAAAFLDVLPVVFDEDGDVRAVWTPDVPGGALERLAHGVTLGLSGDDVWSAHDVAESWAACRAAIEGPLVGTTADVELLDPRILEGGEDTTGLLERAASGVGKSAAKLAFPVVGLVVVALVVLVVAIGASGAKVRAGALGIG